MTTSELKNKWQKEAKSYAKQEVGSGVQKFVKDVFKSADLFNLAESLVSTKLEHRKNEFVEESTTKASRKADVVIYINPEIIIPVEVERYGNIEAGLQQLRNYQLDLEKKYGILTDGFTWRFFNNDYLLKEFSIDVILANPNLFNEFWQEYVKPEFYYLSFFEEIGQQKLFPEDLSVEARRQNFFQDITTLIRSFKNKLDIEGYFKTLEKKEKEKRAVEITYAYIIQFILYKTLVDNDFGDFKKKFVEKNVEIYKCLKQKQYGKILGIIDEISSNISKNIYRPFAKEQEFISKTVLDLFHSAKNELHDVSPWLDIFIFIRKYSFANVRNEIFGYIYENYLKELYEETQKGQYFTDPAVVNFMLDQIGYDRENITKRTPHRPEGEHISLVDPSCGSGTFLYSATDRLIQAVPNGSEESSRKIEELVNGNIFGLDIEEFPLYLAEMNVLMRMLPLIINEKYNNPIDKKIKVFLTKDSIVEFMDTAIRNTISDITVAYTKSSGQTSLFAEKLNLDYSSYVREEGDLEEMKKSLENQPSIPRRRFDYVIGNPPYIGYNECAKQGVLITKLIREKKAQMSNIYGVNLNTVPGRIKAYAPKPNLYAFFVALGLALLKDNGRLCYIIPQTLLTAGDLDVLRYHLAKYTTIEKIITFSGKMFIGRGIKQNRLVATSSLILVVRRKIPEQIHQVEVVNYKDSEDDVETCLKNMARGRKTEKKKILQMRLFQNIANWNFIKQNDKELEFFEHYNLNDTFDVYRIPEVSRAKFNSVFYFDKGLVFPKDEIIEAGKVQAEDCFNTIKVKAGAYQLGLTDMVVPKSSIRFPKGSQGIGVYEKKYKIVWRYMNPDKFYFTNKTIMLSFNWVLISSDNKGEMLYILSLLNSKLNNFIFQKLLKSENEQAFCIGIKTVKEFVRIPKINENNQFIKNRIEKLSDEMLALEEKRLSDFIDFSKVMIQKFSGVSVENDNLVLEKDKKKTLLSIKLNKNLIKKAVDDSYNKHGLKLEKQDIFLEELKNLPVIDLEKQSELKEYIDDLVFALYFNVPISQAEIDRPDKVKNKCSASEFYEMAIQSMEKKK